MDQIKTMMDQLSDLDDSQVSELQSSIIKEFEAVEKEEPSLATVDAMTSLADMLDGVRNEVMRRETAAKELAQRAAEAANRVHGQDGEAADKSMDEENPDAAPADAEAPAAPVEEMPKEEVAAAPMEEEAPVADAPVADGGPRLGPVSRSRRRTDPHRARRGPGRARPPRARAAPGDARPSGRGRRAGDVR